MRRLGLVAVLLALASSSVRADDPKDVAGAWEGTLKPALGVELRLVLHVANGDDGLTALLDSPDQGSKGLKVDRITLEGDTLSFAMDRIKAKFEGELNAEGTEIAGRWKQSGDVPLTFRRVDPEEVARPLNVPEALEGLWAGPIELPGGIELRLVLNVARSDEGKGPLVAKLDSPDQGAKGIPISEIDLEDDTLTFTVKSLGVRFEGKRNEAGEAFEGTFRQSGLKLPLTLKKTETLEEARRPQMPKPPFPYRTEDVRYENADANILLAGTLTLPEGDGPFPAALLITGSGSQDRDETLLGHKPFLVLADDLTRRGIAVLRVDDRGVGGSTGDPKTATSEDFAGDVLSGVGFLRQHPSIDPKKIGLIGHSEGGLIAPMAAARCDEVAFIVLMAGPGLTGEEILSLQSDLIARAMGAKDEALEVQGEELRKSFAVLREERDNAAALKRLQDIAAEALAKLPEEDRKTLGEGEEPRSEMLEQLVSPWFRFFLTYDPRPTLAKVHCPVLAINGEKDLQVPPKENLAAIAEALKSGGNVRLTLREMPGLNHLFQTSKTGAPAEYAKIEETIAPAALEAIGVWIEEQVR